MRTALLLICSVASCGPMTAPIGGLPHDLATPAPPAYCSPMTGVWAQDCQTHCLPAEPVFVICTSKLGRVFYTRSGLRTPQRYGATWEIRDMRCSSMPYRVWALTPAAPTDTAAGFETLAYGSECSTSPVSGFFAQTDKLYYTAVEIVVQSPQ